MSDANVVKLLQPGSFADPLTEVLRNGARALLAQAIEAEVAEFLAKHVDLKTATGLRRVVRHGHLPEREVMTGIGPVGVKLLDLRAVTGAPFDNFFFTSSRTNFRSRVAPALLVAMFSRRWNDGSSVNERRPAASAIATSALVSGQSMKRPGSPGDRFEAAALCRRP